MSTLHHCKTSVVDAHGTVVVSCMDRFTYYSPYGGGWSTVLSGVKSKLANACKGICDPPPEPFHLFCIDEEGDAIALLDYNDFCYFFVSRRKSDAGDTLPHLYAFLPPGPRRTFYNKKTTGHAPIMASKDGDVLLGKIEELTKAVRDLSDLVTMGDVREDWQRHQLKMLTAEDTSSEVLEPIMT